MNVAAIGAHMPLAIITVRHTKLDFCRATLHAKSGGKIGKHEIFLKIEMNAEKTTEKTIFQR